MTWKCKGSAFAVEEAVRCQKPYRLFPSVRLFMFFLLFIALTFGNTCYCIVNMTLVCMVNSTAVLQLAAAEDNATERSVVVSHGEQPEMDGYNGDIIWSREQQANILASYTWDTFLLSIPGGIILDRYGTKLVMLIAQVANIVAFLLMPWVAYNGEWWTFALRFALGLTGGIYWPAALTVASRWASRKEAGLMVALASSGFPVGAILANIISGLFCTVDAHGWQYSYYFWGCANAVFLVIFWLLFQDDPQKHSFITEAEVRFIMRERTAAGCQHAIQLGKIPWKNVLTAGPVLAIVTAEFVAGWIYVIITMFMPTYIKDVLRGVNARENGIFSALPSLLQVLGRFFFGHSSDLISRRVNPNVAVKLFDVMAIGIPGALFFVITFLTSENGMLAIACFSTGQFFYAASIGGFLRSAMQIAPQFIGLIGSFGEISMCASLSIAPYVIGKMTNRGTEEQWQLVMYVAAAISACSVCITILFAQGKLQKWANAPDKRAESISSVVAATHF